MKPDQLKEAGAIYVEQIRDGLELYHNEIRTMTGTGAEEFFLEQLRRLGPGRCFLDFYYFVLEEGARKRVDGCLSQEEKAYLDSMERSEGEFIFPADEMLICIAVRLNESELLFSSFYFVEENGRASIWWGNYGQEYVVMWDGED